MCVRACACERVCACVRACACMRVSVCVHACVCVRVRACVRACLRECVCLVFLVHVDAASFKLINLQNIMLLMGFLMPVFR